MDNSSSDVFKSGHLQKKYSRTNPGGVPSNWTDRYFVLKSHVLWCYTKSGDSQPKLVVPLLSSCVLSKITAEEDPHTKKTQYIFRITWKPSEDKKEHDPDSRKTKPLADTSFWMLAIVAVCGIVFGAVTAGLGLIAGLIVVGVGLAGVKGSGAISGSHCAAAPASASTGLVPAKVCLTLASDSYADAEGWVEAIELQVIGSTTSTTDYLSSATTSSSSNKNSPAKPTANTNHVAHSTGNSKNHQITATSAGTSSINSKSDVVSDLNLSLSSSSSSSSTTMPSLLHPSADRRADLSAETAANPTVDPSAVTTAAPSLAPLRSSLSLSSASSSQPSSLSPFGEKADNRLAEVERWLLCAKWQVHIVHEGVRMLRAEQRTDIDDSAPRSLASILPVIQIHPSTQVPPLLPCLRVNMPIGGSIPDTFSCIMNFSKALRSGVMKSIRIVQNIDNFTDIIHLKLEPIYLEPCWTMARDFCLIRHWRDNPDDGSYMICYDSTLHPDCPLMAGYVRADLHVAYVLSPPKPRDDHQTYLRSVNVDDDESECLLVCVAQLDPKGWVWRYCGYTQQYLQHFMLHVLDIRDALEDDRFLKVQFDPIFIPSPSIDLSSSPGQQLQGSSGATEGASTASKTGTVPPSLLPREMWSEPEASPFKVRGPHYNRDKVKVPSPPCLFKLLAIDLYDLAEPTPNIAAHPNNRVALAKARGEEGYTFVFNIMVPGPPFLSFVVYWEMDRAVIEADTPFGRIARPFFYGNDDEFRNNRFKLIPKVVDGNLVIKMAVKDTPTLLGNKLKQYYHKADHYFELDVDVGSSSVARNVVGLAIGYAKNIVVDMAICLQGNDDSELPELLMGTCSAVHVDVSNAKKL